MKKFEHNDNGDIIYCSHNGVEEWIEYNKDGLISHKRYSNGWEDWYEYNENGDLIFHKDQDGNVTQNKLDYQRNGMIKYYLVNDVISSESHYDKNNLLVKEYDYFIFDTFGNRIEGCFRESDYNYNNNNQLISKKTKLNTESNYDEILKDYDTRGNLIYLKDYFGKTLCCKYDNNGNIIYYKEIYDNGYEKPKLIEESYSFDSDKNLIHYRDNFNNDFRIQYY